MLNLNTVMLCSENHLALVEFYKKVLGKEPDWSGGEYYGFSAGASYLIVGKHSDVHGKNQAPARVMLNFETSDVEGEVARLKGLGVVVVAEPYHPGEDTKMTLATLSDPDGNYFQLATPMEAKQ